MIFGLYGVVFHGVDARDVHKCAALQNKAKRWKTDEIRSKIRTKNFSGVEKWNVGNRLKRVLPKSEGCASHFRGVNGRSKFSRSFFLSPFLCHRWYLSWRRLGKGLSHLCSLRSIQRPVQTVGCFAWSWKEKNHFRQMFAWSSRNQAKHLPDCQANQGNT